MTTLEQAEQEKKEAWQELQKIVPYYTKAKSTGIHDPQKDAQYLAAEDRFRTAYYNLMMLRKWGELNEF